MGMYDIVNYRMACPFCGYEENEFQTKDKERLLSTVEVKDVGNFYTMCDVCDAWLEFSRKGCQVNE